MGSILGPGGSHMPWSSQVCATTTEPMTDSLGAATTKPTSQNYQDRTPQSPCSMIKEAITMRSPHIAPKEQTLLAVTREKSCSNEDSSTVKKINKQINNIFLKKKTLFFLKYSTTQLGHFLMAISRIVKVLQKWTLVQTEENSQLQLHRLYEGYFDNT